MKQKRFEFLVIGFAMFAMFFGAGNLIFPPYLGNLAGLEYMMAMLGFILTGVGLPLVGILACARYNGSFREMSKYAGSKFSLFITISVMLILGPVLTIPRTAATTYELGVAPMFGEIDIMLSVVIYFIINILFVLKPSKVVDIIGKYLTPSLLILLSTIIIAGLINPIGVPSQPSIDSVFTHALLEGYQTMDALGSVIIAAILMESIRNKGYTEKRDIMKITLKAGMVSITGLAFIYGGLTVLGSQTSGLISSDISRTALVIEIAQATLGKVGILALGLAVSLACLTTSIALMTTIAEFFTELFKGIFHYNAIVVAMTGVSIFFAAMGVDKIVTIAAPILGILYPTIMVIVFTSFIADKIGSIVVKASVYTAFTCSILTTLSEIDSTQSIFEFMKMLPLSSVGFAWIFPTIMVFIIMLFITRVGPKKNNY
ncbi:branched-chain amino acid transport system II carrier protein [Vallitalea okinawensis]|uniref:branched-chain amino acid transport system II carrier protein n=1 Tax=Vallitalea okinawensis TaxID=2078660 RepID=UPI000CFAA806|nr:branched-chain amino acid transport system II carrier protein [Vallitalea okinawensis]